MFMFITDLANTQGSKNLTIQLGQSVTLKCFCGWGADHFIFYRGEQEVQSGDKDTYTIDNLQTHHKGTYSCYVQKSADSQAKAWTNEMLLTFTSELIGYIKFI